MKKLFATAVLTLALCVPSFAIIPIVLPIEGPCDMSQCVEVCVFGFCINLCPC